MTLEQYAYLAEIVGVILVVGSLVYVAKQLRQNTDAIRAQSRQAVLAASQAELFAEMENPDLIINIVKSDAMTPEERVKLSSWLFALFRARQCSWLQYRNGVIDEPQWRSEESLILFFLDSQKIRDWWMKLGRAALGDDYADYIDTLTCERPATETTVVGVTNWTA